MKKHLAALLALTLVLSGCAAPASDQISQPEAPAAETATAEAAPEEAALPGIIGTLRTVSYPIAAGQTIYDLASIYDEDTDVTTYTLLAADCTAGTQQKTAELTVRGYCTGLAAWQDDVQLYTVEWEQNNAENYKIFCYRIDPATGQMTQQPIEAPFTPQWYDDAAVYAPWHNNSWIQSITRRDRTTGQRVDLPLPAQTLMICGAAGNRWLLERVLSPAPMPEYFTDPEAFNAMWQNSRIEYDLYDPAARETEKLFDIPCGGDTWDYSGQRDGALYFLHFAKKDGEDYTTPVGLDKLENGTLTPVFTSQNPDWPEFETYSQDGTLCWLVQYLSDSLQIYDLADGKTYTPAVDYENYIGYPIQLLPDGRVVVTDGWVDTTVSTDQSQAWAVMDQTAYLAGSTDRTPITMYTGQ